MLRLRLTIIGAIAGVVCVGIVILLLNCVFYQRTCPQTGSIREALEDVLAAVGGFTFGRASKP